MDLSAGCSCKTLRSTASHAVVDGPEAILAFRAVFDEGQPYDLICMDIVMPGVIGTDVVKLIRDLEESRGIYPRDGAKIIMTTGVLNTREIFRSFTNLRDAYMTKPLDGELLNKKLCELELIRSS